MTSVRNTGVIFRNKTIQKIASYCLLNRILLNNNVEAEIFLKNVNLQNN